MDTLVRIRIIPTRVGTSEKSTVQVIVARDHPHACGDKKKSTLCRVLEVGSSPRVWGQDRKHHLHPSNRRIIPTRVGTSFELAGVRFSAFYHPHACGDKLNLLLSAFQQSGSSPRVWGQVCFQFSAF